MIRGAVHTGVCTFMIRAVQSLRIANTEFLNDSLQQPPESEHFRASLSANGYVLQPSIPHSIHPTSPPETGTMVSLVGMVR
jgi:hypothetical protein